MKIRVRIAPSPTGSPHIGTIWQALINYSYAKRYKGDFIVRIEDTDRKRFIEGAEKELFSALKWFSLEPLESPIYGGSFGPYRQSERLKIYQKQVLKLIDKDKAYYCFCSPERLEQARQVQVKKGLSVMYDKKCREIKSGEAIKRVEAGEKAVIRLKVPLNEKIIVKDLLRGEIEFNSQVLDDQVLVKSDGFPTYHLAVVVDDHLMEISHVVRGEEWLSSAPKHVLLYQYFGWLEPVWVHTPIIRNPDKSKLSKRHGHASVSWYKNNGYLSQAILNFLSLLGWSHPKEKTVFSLTEFTKYFDLRDLSPVGPVVDLKKLDYLNGVYIRNTKDEELLELIKPFLKIKIEDSQLLKIIPLIKERINKLTEVEGLIDFFVNDFKLSPEDLLVKSGTKELVKKQLEEVIKILKDVKWDLEEITRVIQDIVLKNDYHKGQFFMMLRLSLTGKKISPPLLESIDILGREKTLKRLQNSLSLIEN
ncbi:glutamate--tRNA ligase [Candidatus Beckwithbacteria bacterium CG10_big_fil_rev_8_21_14_0_10_34_10]|uniref:Glutamate--tRNA ligase n=1 Tax=Candidatus Beckwithbacteria bacterium CG10_big_fil_rev_8_21_14_0_10_34_10 TaxID=1974495 RepID=A0A2H0W8I0_9BACT|nr:MAG: glutamate--tRNA ligase [Candidatus Beckwithbacteria bacterium CG10_big_fil_rev_8_21_14_0_10_34_10]